MDLEAVNTIKNVNQDIVDKLIFEKTTTHGDCKMNQYVESHLREHPVLKACRDHANSMGALQAMQISADEGAVLQVVAKMIQAKNCLEVGFFTGYSALAVALAIPPHGSVTAIDVNEDWAKIGEQWFEQAGVRHKLNLVIGDGLCALDELIFNGKSGTFDLGFIDADKPGYCKYYERMIELIRPGGVICLDNVFWLDRVGDPKYQDSDTVAIRELNDVLTRDDRIELAYLPTADGVAVCYKKSAVDVTL